MRAKCQRHIFKIRPCVKFIEGLAPEATGINVGAGSGIAGAAGAPSVFAFLAALASLLKLVHCGVGLVSGDALIFNPLVAAAFAGGGAARTHGDSMPKLRHFQHLVQCTSQ